MVLMRDERAVASLFSSSIAGVLFVGSLAALLLATAQLNAFPPSSADPGRQHLAQGVLDIVARSPGNADRGGLAAAPGSDSLSPTSVLGFQTTGYDSPSAFGYANLAYVLGLDDVGPLAGTPDNSHAHPDLDLGFHLRFLPTVDASDGLPLFVVYVGASAAGALTADAQAELDALEAVVAAPGVVAPIEDDVLALPGLAALLADADPGTAGPQLADVLVVGSEVSHVNLASGAPSINAWYYGSLGRTVVILGSGTGALGTWWSGEPGDVFPTAVASSSDVLRERDPFHPLVTMPHALQPAGWSISPAPVLPCTVPPFADGLRTIVGPPEGSEVPLLRLSPAGVFGTGQVVVFGTHPADRDCDNAGAVADEEAQEIFANLLLRHYGTLFLDYGPSLPGDVDARPAGTTMTLADPVILAGAPGLAPDGFVDIPMHVQAWVFPNP